MNFRPIITFFFSCLYVFLSGQTDFKTSSILKSGTWYKIKVNKTGIYKLSYNDLRDIGFDSPESVRIYGNSGKQLPFVIGDDVPDDLLEVPLYESNDKSYYLFYAEGTDYWTFNVDSEIFKSHTNNYAKYNYYYLTSSFGSGKRIEQVDYSSLTTKQTVTAYSWRSCYEEELYNLIGSGREWLGYQFNTNKFNFSFNAENHVSNSYLNIKVTSAVRSETGNTVEYYLNSSKIGEQKFASVNVNDVEALHIQDALNIFELPLQTSSNIFSAQLKSSYVNDKAYLDYLTLNTRCELKITDYPFFFRDIESNIHGGNTLFKLSGANSTTRIWDITDHNNVSSVNGNLTGSVFEFKFPLDTNIISEFVAVSPSGSYPTPILKDETNNDLEWIENQNLHGLPPIEMVIVTHPYFKEVADSLAELHRVKDSLFVQVVTTDQIYNEFSSGRQEASAIRNFARMLWLRSTEENKFKYLLLFGDGTYDNRNFNINNPNYIPTYQSNESYNPIYSYTTDDYYGQLETGEWSTTGNLDIGVGRLPVQWSDGTEDLEAWQMFNKIKEFYSKDVRRDWRNRMIFLGDDGEHGWDATLFMEDSDDLTKIVGEEAPTINFSKIYLDAYNQISSSTGASYPEVEDALQEAFQKGALVFNYMGHGGENGITQEKVLQKSDFANLKNGPYYPLFITATCQVSRFDNVDIEGGIYSRRESAGEAALLNPKGGAIALFTTTRLVYQTSNKILNSSVFNNMFQKDENGKRYRLGDLFRISKNQVTGGDINKLKFALLGDPAITLPYGEFTVVTDSINGLSVSDGTIDTVHALGKATISGHIEDDFGNPMNNFNGVVQISVFDKAYNIFTRGNDPDVPIIEFSVQDKLLFRGNATVSNGNFSFDFKIPKDISYNIGPGKISYYAYASELDAKGYYKDIYIGGTALDVEEDQTGPEIELFMNDENFKSGGITGPNPVLFAKIYDRNGINTTGIGIGHDLSAFLDSNYSDVILLNDYFEGELDNYQEGTIKYPLSNLEPGPHIVSVKIWDTYNNSADASIGFIVKGEDNIIIDKLYNYPNPMTTTTNFQYTHNMPGEHEVKLDIFDLSGKLIYTYENTSIENGFVSTPIQWDRLSGNSAPVQPGVYIYRLTVNVTSEETNKKLVATKTNKIIIIP